MSIPGNQNHGPKNKNFKNKIKIKNKILFNYSSSNTVNIIWDIFSSLIKCW